MYRERERDGERTQVWIVQRMSYRCVCVSVDVVERDACERSPVSALALPSVQSVCPSASQSVR